MQEVQPADVRAIPRVELPKKLGVAVPPGHDIEPVRNLLVAAGFSLDESVGRAPALVDVGSQDFESLPDWLNQHSEGHVLLLFNAPVPTIARLMTDAVEPADTVAQWRKQAEQVLAAVRPNRRRMTLIAMEAAQSDPGTFIDLLGDRFGLALKRPVDTIETGEDPSAVFRMMAENAVWQSPDVRNLAAELEANALPMPPGHGQLLPAVEEVYSEFNTLVERTRARKDKLEEEKSASAQSSEQLTELQTKLTQAERQSDERRKDLEEENELLLQQLHHVQEELESYFLENRDLKRKLEEAQKQQKLLEIQARKATNMLNDVHASLSWKITAPLRVLVRPFMSGNKAISRKQ